MSRRIEIVPQSAALGAEIRGVDLSRPLADETFESIYQALIDHHVIFLRDQEITPHQQLAFAERFGTPVDYPLMKGKPECPQISVLVKEPEDTMNFGGEAFHSDTTYLEVPPAFTMLYAKEVPPLGGDTIFANMCLAHQGLSKGMQAMLDGLTAVNSSLIALQYFRDYQPDAAEGRREISTEHPVVRVMPETGRRALYINTAHTLNFSGMTREESLPLIQYLCQTAVRPEYTYRLRWTRGTITIWDNRCTQHLPVNDYHGHRREMHRITISERSAR